MRIQEFTKGRGVEDSAVKMYIRRHPDIEKNTYKDGKYLCLKKEAVEELEKVYPYPSPVNVVDGIPQETVIKIQNELIMAQKKVDSLHERLLDAQERLAMAEATQILLDDKTKRIEDLETKAEAKDEQIQSLQERLNDELAKTWVQKLFGR